MLDEIQQCPEALNSLKYFAEKAPDHPVACAGSLLGVGLGERVSFPVGKVTFLHLRPLTFREFLDGAQESALAEYIAEATPEEPVPEPVFARFLDWLRTYFVTGGMPEPAADWIEHRDLSRTEKIQRDLLRTYELDFGKHVPHADIPRVRLTWDAVPSQLSREHKKFVFSVLRPGARARDYERAIGWLEQAGMVVKVRRVKMPALPLATVEDPHAFKLYFPDVGLLRAKAGVPARALVDGDRLFEEFRGALTENFVLQELLAAVSEPPRYWTSQATAEVDFVVTMEEEVFPLEVKAGVNVKAKSLRVYCQAYRPRLALRVSLRNLRKDGQVLNVPLFLVGELPRLCAAGLSSRAGPTAADRATGAPSRSRPSARGR